MKYMIDSEELSFLSQLLPSVMLSQDGKHGPISYFYSKLEMDLSCRRCLLRQTHLCDALEFWLQEK